MYVLFDCPKCKCKNVRVEVPERGPENVLEWLSKVTLRVAVRHQAHGCFYDRVDLKIPIDETNPESPIGTEKKEE